MDSKPWFVQKGSKLSATKVEAEWEDVEDSPEDVKELWGAADKQLGHALCRRSPAGGPYYRCECKILDRLKLSDQI